MILVDWARIPLNLYTPSMLHVPKVVREITKMIHFLQDEGVTSMTGVGHSLGAHIIGLAGKKSGKLDYVIGKLYTD